VFVWRGILLLFGGIVVEHYSDGTIVEYYVDVTVVEHYSDGTIVEYYVDVTIVEHYSDGTIVEHYSDETIVEHYSDGTIVEHYSDGTIVEHFIDGTIVEHCSNSKIYLKDIEIFHVRKLKSYVNSSSLTAVCTVACNQLFTSSTCFSISFSPPVAQRLPWLLHS
jgi:hypothetical protein